MGNNNTFSANFRRMTSPLIILSLLQDRPMYSYEIKKYLSKFHNGILDTTSLYQLLYQAEKQGLVTSTESLSGERRPRVRVYYSITPEGKTTLDSILAEYQAMSSALHEFLNRDISL